ncbi:hypothetical protein [Nostoc sp. PCC 9305]|uniref:hypothetical protein n=1 Tax=Nostoc sp. PCC 9305 TaxID=296636 RepID=UPI0039C75925
MALIAIALSLLLSKLCVASWMVERSLLIILFLLCHSKLTRQYCKQASDVYDGLRLRSLEHTQLIN